MQAFKFLVNSRSMMNPIASLFLAGILFVSGLSGAFAASLIPLIGVSIDNVTVSEPNTGTKNAYFHVRLTDEPMHDIEIGFTTANDTAVAFEDYGQKSGRLVFRGPRVDKLTDELLPGQTEKLIAVTIKSDTDTDETSETFFMNLSNPLNVFGITFVDSQGVATITPPGTGGGGGGSDGFPLPE